MSVSGFSLGFVLWVLIKICRAACASAREQREVEESSTRNNNGATARVRPVVNRESELHPIQRLLISVKRESNSLHLNEALDDGHSDFQSYSSKDPVASELKKYVHEDNWQSLSNELSRMKNNGLSNDDRSSYFRIIVDEIEKSWPTERTDDMASFSHLLDQWMKNERNNVDCMILRIGAGIAWAWHARSSYYAHRVGVQQWRLFHERLNKVASEVKTALSLHPAEPLIYQEAITLKMGLGDRNPDIMSVEASLDALNSIGNEPLSYSAHRRALHYYCKKWHGSHNKMFAHARSVVAKLPDGHPLWVLIAEAHTERYHLEGNIGYWKLQSVVNEIRESYRRAFPGDAKFSIQATSPRAEACEMSCRNFFAFCLMATGQYEDARTQIRLIGKCPTDGYPWGHFKIYKLFINALGFDTSTPYDGDTANGNETQYSAPLVAAEVTDVSADDDAPIATAVAVQIV